MQAPADMAELVDAPVSGTGGSNALEVQVLLSAPRFRGCSSVDRALRSHRRGRGFESHQLHQGFIPSNGRFFVFRPCWGMDVIIAGAH